MVFARSVRLFQLAVVSMAFLTSAFAAEAADASTTTDTAGTSIHPGANVDLCLDVPSDERYNGAPVQIHDCNDSPAQKWVFKKGQTSIKLAGTNYCLDAGEKPADGTPLKLWECYENLRVQDWYITDDDRVALREQGFCMDVTRGQYVDGNPVQIWSCTDDNWNQVWWDNKTVEELPFCA